MTTWYVGVCVCGEKLNIPKGGGWSHIQMVCDTCGSLRDIPRYFPADAAEMTEMDIAAWLAKDPRSWPVTGGRRPTTKEALIIDRLTRSCPCSGRFFMDFENGASYRCPKCKSDQFEWIAQSGRISD